MFRLRLRLKRQEMLLFLLSALLLVAILTVPAFLKFGGDNLDKAQRRLAGENAIDCGVGHMVTIENNLMSSDRSNADACAVAAFKTGKPYRVRYDTRIDDGANGPEVASSGSVLTPQGQVYFFYYSFSNHGRFFNNWFKKSLDYRQATCPQPVIFQKAVGCGTCAELASIDAANCILHP